MITKEEVTKRCETIFDAIGVNISDKELMGTLDSLQYISALVELETEFGIQFPDDVLVVNIFQDMDGFYELLMSLLQGRGE